MRHQRLVVVVLGCAACFACDDRSDVLELKLPDPSRVISTESGLLAGPSGIAIDSTGRIWIADFQAKRLVSVAPDGSDPLVVGREGEGPGELRGPLGIAAIPGGIRVADAFNNRFQDYRVDGSPITDHAPTVNAIGGAAIASDGRYIVPVFGSDSVLAALHQLGNNTVVTFGTPVVAATVYRTPEAQWADVRARTIPREMRNVLFPAVGGSALYLVLAADATVQKYDQDGQLQWKAELRTPEVEKIRDAFFAARSDTSSGPPQTLLALTQASEVGNAVWVLLNTAPPDPAVLFLLDKETGAIEARLEVTLPAGPLKFAVDRTLARVYLTVPDEAAVYAADIAAVPQAWR